MGKVSLLEPLYKHLSTVKQITTSETPNNCQWHFYSQTSPIYQFNHDSGTIDYTGDGIHNGGAQTSVLPPFVSAKDHLLTFLNESYI